MGQGHYKSERNRQKKTDAEEAVLQNKKNAAASKGTTPLTSFYQPNRQEQDSGADTEQLPHKMISKKTMMMMLLWTMIF